MQVPDWFKPAILGAACGAIAMSVVGFHGLGWTTRSAAGQVAQEQSDTAVISALVPFCVAKAEQDPDHATLAKIRTEQSAFSRSDLVMRAGWATVGSETAPDPGLAHACSQQLLATKTG